MFCCTSFSLDPCEILIDFLLSVDGCEDLISVAIACAVETLADEVENAGVTMDVVFHLEATEIVAVHDDELTAAAMMLGHDVITLAGLTMSLIGHFDCLAEAK